MQIDPIARGVGQRLKRLWRRSGDPRSPATYEEICDASPHRAEDEMTAKDKLLLVGAVIGVAIMLVALLIYLGEIGGVYTPAR